MSLGQFLTFYFLICTEPSFSAFPNSCSWPAPLLSRFDRAFSFCLRLGCRPLFACPLMSYIPHLDMPPSAVLFHFSKPVDFDRFRTRIITRTPWLWSSLYAILSVCFFSFDVLVVLVLFLMMLVDHFSALPSPAGCSFTLD